MRSQKHSTPIEETTISLTVPTMDGQGSITVTVSGSPDQIGRRLDHALLCADIAARKRTEWLRPTLTIVPDTAASSATDFACDNPDREGWATA